MADPVVPATEAVPPVSSALAAPPAAPQAERTGRFAALVAIGIFTSRIAGLVRQSVFAYYFGASMAGDAFQAAFRIPNLLQNLFGEGVLSASFIPEYAGLNAREQKEEARRVAGAVFSALVLLTSVIVLLGVLFAPALVDVLAGGFREEEKRVLTTTLVQILFPGAALLVFSAWCLGVLNSHRKFLLSYLAPVAWNAVMVGALVIFGAARSLQDLAIILAWASVVGSAAQFVVQLPTVIRVAGRIRPNLQFNVPGVRRVFNQFGPAFLARGVVQISAFVDLMLASFLPGGSVVALAYAQTLYMVPGSLFGMSVSAAELPVMSSATGSTDEIAGYLRGRLQRGMQRIAYFVIPCVIAFVAFGDVMVSSLFERGRFTSADTVWVWVILIGASIGLLASTLGRLVVSAFYALRDTRTPLQCAVIRIVSGTVLGIGLAFYLPSILGVEARWGTAGLAAGSGIGACVEFIALRRRLGKVIGPARVGASYLLTAIGSALLAAVIASAWRFVLPDMHAVAMLVLIGVTFGAVYLGATYAQRNAEAIGILEICRSKLGRRNRV